MASMAALKEIDAVIVFKCGVLSLWLNHGTDFEETETPLITSEDYHALKSACHTPIILLDAIKSECLSKTEMQEVHAYAQQCLTQLGGMRKKKHQDCIANIMNRTMDCVEQLSHSVRLTLQDEVVIKIISEYKISISADIDYLSAQAATMQLNLLHETTQQWILKYNLDLSKTRVLLVAPHGPRKGLIEMQYYLKLFEQNLLNRPIKDNYVYYVEMLGSQLGSIKVKEQLINEFLAREEQNKTVASWLLDNPLGMQQDVLKEQAPEIISQLLSAKSKKEVIMTTNYLAFT